MELAIITTPDGGLSIKDFESIKQELATSLAHYKTLVFTADEIKAAKEYRAQLNRTSDALKENFRNKKKDLLQQLETLDRQTNDLIGIVWECSDAIDRQIKAFENEEKAKKLEQCNAIFAEEFAGLDWIKFEAISNDRWTNKTFTLAKVAEEMKAKRQEIENNLDTLEHLDAFAFEAVEEYKRTLDINKAITEGQRLADIQRRKEEAKRKAEEEARKAAEEEAKRAAEIEAQKAAEREAESGQISSEDNQPIENTPEAKEGQNEPIWSAETHELIMTVDGKGFRAEITEEAKAELNKIIKNFIKLYSLKMWRIGGEK